MDKIYDIDKGIKKRFDNYYEIEESKSLPDIDNKDNLRLNKIYNTQFASIAVDVVNFKKMSDGTEQKIFMVIMEQLMSGVIRIMKMHSNPYKIQIQGDGAYAIYEMDKEEDTDKLFKTIIALNSFQSILSKEIKDKFHDELKMNKSINYKIPKFEFGIGASFSKDNYMSVVGDESDNDIIFMGHSLNCASSLSKKSSRNDLKKIIIDEGFYNRLTMSIKEKINPKPLELKEPVYDELFYNYDLFDNKFYK